MDRHLSSSSISETNPVFLLDQRPMKRASSFDSSLESRVQALWAWDLKRIKDCCKRRYDYSDDYLQSIEREYKRYLELRLRYRALNMPMADPVDPMWHEHILFSPDYRKMCDAVFGRYLDHKPYETTEEFEGLRSAYESNTLGMYSKHFGEPDPSWWPINKQCCTYNCGTPE